MKMRESEKIDKYLELARELRNRWNMKVTVISIIVEQFPKAWKRALQNWKAEEESRPYRPQLEHLGRLAVAQTPVKDHQLMLVRKTHKK